MADHHICFEKLGAAYETLSDKICRAKYDATLASYQRAGQRRPADWQDQTSSNASAWQEDMRRRAWNWCRNAQDAADQARREDAAYWSAPSYAHGAFDEGEWRKQHDRDQRDLHEYRQQQRAARKAARKEARRQAGRKKRDTCTPPPPRTSDQDGEGLKARAERDERDEETEEKARWQRHEDDGGRRTPPFPQRPDPDWSDTTEREYQQRLQKERQERANRRKAESEQFEETWRAELKFLLSSIIDIRVDIEETAAKADGSKMSIEVRYFEFRSSLRLHEGGETRFRSEARVSSQNVVYTPVSRPHCVPEHGLLPLWIWFRGLS